MADERISFGYTDGATVSVEIVRQADSPTQFRYDWDDGVFKVAGWVERQRDLTEDVTTPGLFEDVVDPATWADGVYTFVITEAAITPPIAVRVVEVASGQFSSAPGVARAVLHSDVAAVDEDALFDETGATNNKLATLLVNIWRRWYGKVIVDRPAGEQIVFRQDDAAALATSPISDDGNTQTIGPAV